MLSRLKVVVLILLNSLVFSNTMDLSDFIQQEYNKKVLKKTLSIPNYVVMKKKYAIIDANNLFDDSRLSSLGTDLLERSYTIQQLRMVGYMRKGKEDYAFLKTPYNIILVKKGDKLQNGRVIKITEDSAELARHLFHGDKKFDEKVYLSLENNK